MNLKFIYNNDALKVWTVAPEFVNYEHGAYIIESRQIVINLSSYRFQIALLNENIAIDRISETIQHEYLHSEIHKVLKNKYPKIDDEIPVAWLQRRYERLPFLRKLRKIREYHRLKKEKHL